MTLKLLVLWQLLSSSNKLYGLVMQVCTLATYQSQCITVNLKLFIAIPMP